MKNLEVTKNDRTYAVNVKENIGKREMTRFLKATEMAEAGILIGLGHYAYDNDKYERIDADYACQIFDLDEAKEMAITILEAVRAAEQQIKKNKEADALAEA